MNLLSAAVTITLAAPPSAGESEPPAQLEPSAASDSAPESEAELERRAQAAFQDGRYDDVVELAARAYALTGHLRHLYAQAHAERFRGDCTAALALYARVLAADPDGPLGRHSADGIRLCERELQAADPEPEAEPQPAAASESSSPGAAALDTASPRAEPPASRSAPGWIRDRLGGALLGVGFGGVALGAGLTVAAAAQARAADRAEDERAYADALRGSDRFLYGGAASFAVGGVLVVGAIVRYAVVARRGRPRGPTGAIGPGSAWLGWSGSF